MPSAVLQIVPSLPPAVSGVGDYATSLARELQGRYDVASRFLVGDPTWAPSPGGPEFPARAVAARTVPALLQALADEAPTTILLHYVPYGYAPRGCPFWLVAALRQWRHRRPGARLLTVFHELSADHEPPWRTAFWLCPFQRRLGRQLGRLSTVRRLTTARVADQLRAMLPPGDNAVEAVPVFSNLGELVAPLPTNRRQRRMVVFGTRTWREEVYRRHRDHLLAACRQLGVESVLDVGPTLASPPADLPLPFVAHGLLQPADAPAVFGQSLAGFFTYPAPWLGKSGIFAAYCAHGLVPVTIPGNDQPNADGLRPNEHYLVGRWDLDPAAIAGGAHAWYQQHRLAVHADGVQRALAALAPPGLPA